MRVGATRTERDSLWTQGPPSAQFPGAPGSHPSPLALGTAGCWPSSVALEASNLQASLEAHRPPWHLGR